MHSRPFHAARLTLAFLAAGAASNVLVAWGIVLAHGRTPHLESGGYYFNPHNNRPTVIHAAAGFGIEWITNVPRPGTMLLHDSDIVDLYPGVAAWPAEAPVTGWADKIVVSGWPFPSLTGWRTLVGDEQPEARWCLMLAEEPRGMHKADGNTYPSLVPLRPVWPHFLASSLVHGLALAALAALFTTLRRRWRNAHHTCTRCAYPIATLARCPECGMECRKERRQALDTSSATT